MSVHKWLWFFHYETQPTLSINIETIEHKNIIIFKKDWDDSIKIVLTNYKGISMFESFV